MSIRGKGYRQLGMQWSRALVCGAALMLAACGGESTPAASSTTATAPATAVDPAVAKLYAQTCRACHSSPRTAAPTAGDRRAWAPRMALGMDVLVERTINGYRGMPPLGGCMDCTEDDFAALIRFMAGE